MCGVCGQLAVGAWMPGVGGHTELPICGCLLLCLLDLVGLLAVRLHSVIAFADDPLGLLLGSCGQRRCLATNVQKGRETDSKLSGFLCDAHFGMNRFVVRGFRQCMVGSRCRMRQRYRKINQRVQK